MKTYESMKPSTVFWLGMIPEHWEERFLEQTCHEKCVKNIGNTESNVLSLSYGYIIKKKNVYSGLVAKDFSTYQIVQNGDIILRFTDLQNDHKSLRTGLVTQTGIITSAYTCIVPTINSAYLHYLLHAYDLRKVFYGMGGGVRQSIGYKDVRHMTVLVPPREEQDQIVRFLDWKVSEINKLINIKRKEIERLEELKKAGISHAITESNGRIVPLKRCLHSISDIDHYMPQSVERGYPYVMTGDLKPQSSDIDFVNCKQISQEDFNALSKKSNPQRGNIIFARYATIGTVCYVDTNLEFLVSYSCVTLKPNDLILGKYLFYYLKSNNFFEDINQYIKINTQGNVGIESIRKAQIILPSIEEQQEIIRVLDDVCEQTELMIDNKRNQINVLQDFKTRLISDVVTGKIDVRGIDIPEYEYVDEVAGSDTEDADSEEAIEEQED